MNGYNFRFSRTLILYEQPLAGTHIRRCRQSSSYTLKQKRHRSSIVCCSESNEIIEDVQTGEVDSQDCLINFSRRQMVGLSSSVVALLTWVDAEAQASKLGATVDSAWEKVGGGPADLYFPSAFEGVWDVDSILVDTKTPLGEEYVPDLRALTRARNEDLNKVLRYQISFRRNSQNQIIMDRVFNTTKLVEAYLGNKYNFEQRIQWNPDDPNILTLLMPGGRQVLTRVTRRSFNQPADDLIETSEYFEQLFESPDEGPPKLKGSQCFTKYRWRDEELANQDEGPVIVATQVVSDYLTGYDDQIKLLEAKGRPVVVFVYKMALKRAQDTVQQKNNISGDILGEERELFQVQ
eukprot:TRINITY_DN2201_c1_g1_i10.p1 TRINITY_DN2201_c1_g1~~TRINITY_DN2201_c1_g1_i10.p1  ORF type:complete len:350 (-),score=52.21 TRINITY_DN2201_c1_g1_i10:639-1688(-)